MTTDTLRTKKPKKVNEHIIGTLLCLMVVLISSGCEQDKTRTIISDILETYETSEYCSSDQCNNHGICTNDFCFCEQGYEGATCDQCAEGYVNYPECTANLCESVTCNHHGTCEDGICICYENYTGETCGQCILGLIAYPSCVECVVDEDCSDNAPYCYKNKCIPCIPDETPPPAESMCEGVCALYPPECIDNHWVCSIGMGYESQEQSCDGFDNDCDGEVDENVCGPENCVIDIQRVNENLFAIWDIDFDYQCNTYLTTMRSGADYVTVVPADPQQEVITYYGNANQNMGYALVDPDPDNHRVVVTYSCCAECACQAYNGTTLLYTCDASEPDCPCANQTNCPGFLNFPFIRAGYENTGITYNSSWVVTPTGLAAGPGNSYYIGNFKPDRCWAFGTCVACDPDHEDVWCTPSTSPCCDTTSLGRLAQFTLPENGEEATWRVVQIFEGEQIANIASARDGTVMIGTLNGRTLGNLYQYDPVNNMVTLIREWEATVFSITQDRRNGDWYVEVQAEPKIRRLAEDGSELPLPETVTLNPDFNGVLQYGPDGKLYRLIGRTQSDATLEVYDLP